MHNTHTNSYYVVRTNILKNKSDQSMGTNYQISRILYMTRNPNEILVACNEFTGTRQFQSTRITTCGAEKQSFSMSLKVAGWEEVSFQRREIPERFGGSSENAGLCTSKMMDWRGRQVNQGVNCMCGNILVVFLVFHYPISKSQTFCNTSSICSTWLESSAKHVRK